MNLIVINQASITNLHSVRRWNYSIRRLRAQLVFYFFFILWSLFHFPVPSNYDFFYYYFLIFIYRTYILSTNDVENLDDRPIYLF
jgi:hypothetical protein